MSKASTHERALRLYVWLKVRQERKLTRTQMAHAIGEIDNGRFQAILNHIKVLAREDGLTWRWPTYDEDFTYMLTANADQIISGAVMAQKQEDGVHRRKMDLVTGMLADPAVDDETKMIAKIMKVEDEASAAMRKAIRDLTDIFRKEN
jgi:hypothetical protein